MERFDEHLQFELPALYQIDRSINDKGEDVFRILFDPTTGDDGKIKADFSFSVVCRDDITLTEENSNLKGTFPGAFKSSVQEAKITFFTVQILVAVAVIGCNENTYAIISNKIGRSEEEVQKNAELLAPHFHEVLNSVVLDGKRAAFDPISADRFLNGGDEESDEFPKAVPGDGQHSQLDFQKTAREGLGFLGGLVNINATGTEYSFQSVREISAQSDGGTVPAILEKACRLDSMSFPLSERALEMSGLFRVEMDVFDTGHDREQEIRNGLIHRAMTYNGLRSFAWTLSAFCKEHSTDPEKISFEVLLRMARFLERRKWINYQEDDNCPTLCSGDDIHVYYLPDALPAQDRQALLSAVNEGSEDAISRSSVMSLDGLRRDLLYMFPAIETIYGRLSAERNRSEALEGGVSDVLYAWCAMAYAAREPIFTEDGPMNNWFQHPEQEARWEEEWRRQREEERKQRASEWMSKYGKYLEKNPRINFNGSKFVFSGVEEDNWLEILEKMTAKGGLERSAVSGKTDYLVCDPGGYGESKIKEAVSQRIKGKPVKIVLLKDFLTALGMDKP